MGEKTQENVQDNSTKFYSPKSNTDSPRTRPFGCTNSSVPSNCVFSFTFFFSPLETITRTKKKLQGSKLSGFLWPVGYLWARILSHGGQSASIAFALGLSLQYEPTFKVLGASESNEEWTPLALEYLSFLIISCALCGKRITTEL